MDGQHGGRIPTNLRALMILEIMGQQSEPMTAAEIGREIGLPKQTIHRLCNTLAEEGFLVREAGGLRPGRRARLLAGGTLHASTSHIARHQILSRIAAATGETVNFVVPEDQGMSYKDRVETNWPFRVQLPVGSHVPFHCTASGKTFLASLGRQERVRLVHAIRLEAHTPNTITDPDRMMEELATISRRGYALDDEEFVEGMSAIAVAIRDPSGRYLASIGVHGPSQRFPASVAATHASLLNDAAGNLARVICDT